MKRNLRSKHNRETRYTLSHLYNLIDPKYVSVITYSPYEPSYIEIKLPRELYTAVVKRQLESMVGDLDIELYLEN